MAPVSPEVPIAISFLSLNCHIPVSSGGHDQIYLKYNGNRIYPTKGQKYQRIFKGDRVKFEDLSLAFSRRDEVDTVVIELWYRKNLVQNALAGRFFLMLNISEIGISATQLIRNTEQNQSHYLLHCELTSLQARPRTEEDVKVETKTDEGLI